MLGEAAENRTSNLLVHNHACCTSWVISVGSEAQDEEVEQEEEEVGEEEGHKVVAWKKEVAFDKY